MRTIIADVEVWRMMDLYKKTGTEFADFQLSTFISTNLRLLNHFVFAAASTSFERYVLVLSVPCENF
jgi:hypothetical protein